MSGIEIDILSGTDAEPVLLFLEDIAREEAWDTKGQLRAYPKASTHVSICRSGSVVAGAQIVRCEPGSSLPCLTVWPELKLFVSQAAAADIAVLAVSRAQRSISAALMWTACVEIFRCCRRLGIETVIAEVTPVRMRQYASIGLPFQVLGELRPHWGEFCYPVQMRVEDAVREIVGRAHSRTNYHKIVQHAYRTDDLLAVEKVLHF